MAFENANSETIEQGGIFSPQNWIKRKSSLKDIRNAVRSYLKTMRLMPGGKEISDEIQRLLRMSNNEFEERWTAE